MTRHDTYRAKRDADGWSHRTENEMVRCLYLYIERGASERLLFKKVLHRYLYEVTTTKKPSTQQTEIQRAKPLKESFGKYVLAAITPIGSGGIEARDLQHNTYLVPQELPSSVEHHFTF